MKFTPTERMYIWDRFPHKCLKCRRRITKVNEMEIFPLKIHRKEERSIALTHRICNRN